LRPWLAIAASRGLGGRWREIDTSPYPSIEAERV